MLTRNIFLIIIFFYKKTTDVCNLVSHMLNSVIDLIKSFVTLPIVYYEIFKIITICPVATDILLI